MGALQAAEASGSEEEAPAEAATGEEEREEGEIIPPATPVDKKAQRLQARRAAAQAAADELKVCQPSAFCPWLLGYQRLLPTPGPLPADHLGHEAFALSFVLIEPIVKPKQGNKAGPHAPARSVMDTFSGPHFS